MNGLWLSRTSLVWALLVVATLLSWQFGHGVGFDNAKAAGMAILLVTFVKVRFVMLDFMELRDAPQWMRLCSQAWMVIVAAVLIGLFLSDTR